ncbi:protein of unknown function (plasmid) [Thiomonas sp. Sup16B3]|nr:hypothetical protein THICB3140002 [Thiomonas sp. CB3]CQR42508.1 hypothetical protein THICB3280005 [Thiomonas sp. CB3]CQR43463.1 hypothetical protein THICB3320513 [Thiomonas sp. CB3]VDY11039.1 protein of unknown function [Thiomonas sp. Sup16B3]
MDAPGSCDALQIGPHHVGYAADLGIAPDVIDRCLVAGPRVLQGLQRHIQADLVAVLEAVRHGLCNTVHPELDAIAFNFLDACRVSVARELHHLDRRMVEPWGMAAARHGDPDLARQLGGQFVELQRGEQAEHGLRHLGGDGHETLKFRPVGVRQTVQATPNLFQQASGGQARQDDPGRIDGVQIAGAQHPLLAGQNEDALSVCVGEHGWSMFRLFVECNRSTKNRSMPAMTGWLVGAGTFSPP